jgi:hypothetical protein
VRPAVGNRRIGGGGLLEAKGEGENARKKTRTGYQ